MRKVWTGGADGGGLTSLTQRREYIAISAVLLVIVGDLIYEPDRLAFIVVIISLNVARIIIFFFGYLLSLSHFNTLI